MTVCIVQLADSRKLGLPASEIYAGLAIRETSPMADVAAKTALDGTMYNFSEVVNRAERLC